MIYGALKKARSNTKHQSPAQERKERVMTKKYTPAIFQPTVRPSWAGAFAYIGNEELAQILKAITNFPNVKVKNSAFWNQTIKPDLDNQYQNFKSTCEKRGYGAKTYWGEHKLSISSTQGKLCKDKDKDKDNIIINNINNNIPSIENVLEYAREMDTTAGYGGFACTEQQATEFYLHYQAQGWRIGNDASTPIRDWKAKLRQWVLKDQKKTTKEPITLKI